MNMKRILVLLCVFGNAAISSGQQSNGKEEAVGELKKVADVYRNAQRLSFEMDYYYSEENNPSRKLDSLHGSCRMNGTAYWYRLDSVETLYSKDYVMVLFRPDKLMYLTR